MIDMQTQQFVDALRSILRKQMNDWADDVATGSCTSYDAYKELCGAIRGLAVAERELLDLAQRLKDDEQ